MQFSEDLFISNAILHRRLSAIAEDEFAMLAMSPSHAFVLLQLIRKPGCQPGWVAKRLGLAASSVTRIVDKLERMQLVEKRSKGRSQALHPTERGKEYESRVESIWRTIKVRTEGILGEEATADLVSQLKQIEGKL